MYIPDLTNFVGDGYENLSYPHTRSTDTLGELGYYFINGFIYFGSVEMSKHR